MRVKSNTELQRVITELHRVSFSLRPLILCALCVKLFLLTSCSEEKKEPASKGIYFDLAGYFKAEGEKLNSQKPGVTKTIIKDGEKETKILSDSIDWKKELKIFADADINKPAWKQSFRTDTLKDGNNYIISCKTTDEKIPVKEIAVVTDSVWQPIQIFIKRIAKNFLYNSQQSLYYVPGKYYRLESEMNVRWTFETKFSVEGTFTNRE